jgi:hypothetical protein
MTAVRGARRGPAHGRGAIIRTGAGGPSETGKRLPAPIGRAATLHLKRADSDGPYTDGPRHVTRTRMRAHTHTRTHASCELRGDSHEIYIYVSYIYIIPYTAGSAHHTRTKRSHIAHTSTHASCELRGDSLEPQRRERGEALQAGGERRRAGVADLVRTAARRGGQGGGGVRALRGGGLGEMAHTFL